MPPIIGIGIPSRRRSAPGGSAPADPGTLGAAAWWRGDTTTNDGTNVSQASDRIGTRHATQATVGRRPAPEAAGLGGQASVLHTAANTDALIIGGSDFAAGAKAVQVVYQLATTAAGQVLCDLKVTGSKFCEITLGISGYRGIDFLFDYGALAASCGVAWTLDTLKHSLIVEYNGGAISAAASYRVWLDGVAQTVLTSSNFGTPGIGAIGDRCDATGAHVGFALNGRWADISVFERTLTAGDVTALSSYDDRYGL